MALRERTAVGTRDQMSITTGQVQNWQSLQGSEKGYKSRKGLLNSKGKRGLGYRLFVVVRCLPICYLIDVKRRYLCLETRFFSRKSRI